MLRDVDLIPRSGRSPGGGHGNPLQYFCLENAMDRGFWRATVHGVTKSRTQLKRLQANYIILLLFYHMTKMNLLAILQSSFSHSVIFVTLNTVNSKDHALKLPSGWLKHLKLSIGFVFAFFLFSIYLFIWLCWLPESSSSSQGISLKRWAVSAGNDAASDSKCRTACLFQASGLLLYFFKSIRLEVLHFQLPLTQIYCLLVALQTEFLLQQFSQNQLYYLLSTSSYVSYT